MDQMSQLLMGMAGKLAIKQFLGRTYRQRSIVAVGTGATNVLKNNPDRVGWTIVNRSTGEGALDFIQGLSFAQGVYMGPTGGFASMQFNEDGEACGDEVWGIQNTVAGNWYVTEIIALPDGIK